MDQLELFRNFGNQHRLKHIDMLIFGHMYLSKFYLDIFPWILGKCTELVTSVTPEKERLVIGADFSGQVGGREQR